MGPDPGPKTALGLQSTGSAYWFSAFAGRSKQRPLYRVMIFDWRRTAKSGSLRQNSLRRNVRLEPHVHSGQPAAVSQSALREVQIFGDMVCRMTNLHVSRNCSILGPRVDVAKVKSAANKGMVSLSAALLPSGQ